MEPTTSTSSVTVPSSPFLRINGDVILRTSDGQDFFVVKAILTIASSFFESMFSLPQPQDESGVPIITVSENSTTLDTLLRLCYPVKAPIVADLALAEAVLAAALKYEMEVVVQGMCRMLVSEKTLGAQAVRVYAIACRHNLIEEARLAAIASLRHGAPIEDIYVDEFDTLPTFYYFHLLKFHRRVKEDICKVLQNSINAKNVSATPISEEDSIESNKCLRTTRYRTSQDCTDVAGWWELLISTRVIPAVRNAPFDPRLFSSHDLDAVLRRAETCASCKTAVAAQWPATVASLRQLFERKTSAAAAELLTF